MDKVGPQPVIDLAQKLGIEQDICFQCPQLH